MRSQLRLLRGRKLRIQTGVRFATGKDTINSDSYSVIKATFRRTDRRFVEKLQLRAQATPSFGVIG